MGVSNKQKREKRYLEQIEACFDGVIIIHSAVLHIEKTLSLGTGNRRHMTDKLNLTKLYR